MRRSATGLADQPKVGKQLEQRRVDRSALANEDEYLGVADLRRSLCHIGRPVRLYDHLVLRGPREAREPLDRSLVVLHHDDAHEPTLTRIPHGCYDPARPSLGRTCSSFTPR